MIASPTNPKLRYVRRLAQAAFRARERRLFVEGVRLAEEMLDAGARPAFALVSDDLDATERGRLLRRRLIEHAVPTFDVERRLLAEIAGIQTSQGILAVVPMPDRPLPEAPRLVVVVDGLRDPGNLGTLLRTAAAAGVDAVLLAPGTVDASNPKAVRAAMGAHFRIPIHALDWAAVESYLRLDIRIWLADVGGAEDYAAVDWRAPAAVIVAGEAHGPSAEARRLAGGTIRIPMPGAMESLNAATAAAVILFEVVRQRRRADGGEGLRSDGAG